MTDEQPDFFAMQERYEKSRARATESLAGLVSLAFLVGVATALPFIVVAWVAAIRYITGG